MENCCLPSHIIKGTSTETDASSMLNEIELPSKRLFSCASICAFSKQAKHRLEYEEQCKSARKLWGFIALSLLFMVVEIVGGVKANSLAILTDAAHMLTDVAGFAISPRHLGIRVGTNTPSIFWVFPHRSSRSPAIHSAHLGACWLPNL